jgi:hypothetical protein
LVITALSSAARRQLPKRVKSVEKHSKPTSAEKNDMPNVFALEPAPVESIAEPATRESPSNAIIAAFCCLLAHNPDWLTQHGSSAPRTARMRFIPRLSRKTTTRDGWAEQRIIVEMIGNMRDSKPLSVTATLANIAAKQKQNRW